MFRLHVAREVREGAVARRTTAVLDALFDLRQSAFRAVELVAQRLV
jgi:hypothetical protein